jgi:hypothetical protein
MLIATKKMLGEIRKVKIFDVGLSQELLRLSKDNSVGSYQLLRHNSNYYI